MENDNPLGISEADPYEFKSHFPPDLQGKVQNIFLGRMRMGHLTNATALVTDVLQHARDQNRQGNEVEISRAPDIIVILDGYSGQQLAEATRLLPDAIEYHHANATRFAEHLISVYSRQYRRQ